MSGPAGTVLLFDIDDTLIDNDAAQADYGAHLAQICGPDAERRYWEFYEQIRQESGFADYLAALQQLRLDRAHDHRLFAMSSYLLDYPFASRLYPKALDVLTHMSAFGRPVILSDGDAVFQPRKIARSGIEAAVDGRVLIYVHKEKELSDIEQRYPAEHYVLFDDKIRILATIKPLWGERVTTVFVRQGHYAADQDETNKYPPADLSIDAIGDALNLDWGTILAGKGQPEPVEAGT